MFSPHIFRANDIRGCYTQDFDLSFTKELAVALAHLLRQRGITEAQILIGQDARLSSPEISKSLAHHLKQQGMGVASIGLAPSPLCYFLLYHYKLTACIVVTASHNPVQDNGFKILFHRKYSIVEPIKELKDLCLKRSASVKTVIQQGPEISLDKEGPYISSLQKEFSIKPFSFVVDTGNGALGPLAKKALSALDLKPTYLFNEPDGRFPNHHPDPTVEKNLFDLKRKVKATGSTLGFGFDGDGDRLVLVTQEGQTILGDDLGYVFLKSLSQFKSKYNSSRLVLADVKCSDWFFDSAKEQGLKTLMTKSGHGLIRAKMEETKALMALEFSGHVFFNDRENRGFDDALYASLRLLELLGKTKTDIRHLLPLVSTAKSPEIRVDMPASEVSKNILKVRDYLEERGESFKDLDGLRLSRTESWVLFRSSKTQSALTMRFEAPSRKEMLQLKQEFSKVMGFSIL